jgi:hypothetical protein
MPLTRLNDSAFDVQLEGIYFGMWNGSTSVRCFVSHEALTERLRAQAKQKALTSSTNIEMRSRTLQAPNTTLG